jgi:hypothetical protein
LLSISKIISFLAKYSLKHKFNGASFGSSKIPSCLSFISHNSSALQIIPSLISHLIFVFAITKSGASFAQTIATGTFNHSLTFAAPQTICNFCQFTSTIVQCNFSLSLCFLQDFTSQIKT